MYVCMYVYKMKFKWFISSPYAYTIYLRMYIHMYEYVQILLQIFKEFVIITLAHTIPSIYTYTHTMNVSIYTSIYGLKIRRK